MIDTREIYKHVERKRLEKLIVRCLVKGVIQPQGVDYLFRLIQ